MTAEGGGGILSNEDVLVNGIPHPASPGAPFHKGAGRGKPLPYKITGALPDLGRGGPWASRQDSDRERWLKKLRRSCGTAPDTIFRSLRARWPGGNLDTHSDFAHRKGFACFKG